MKNITIRQLKAFECVARNLSFSRAAEDLHLSQPAVSMQIKQIENQAGMSLFSQTGKRIALTEAGELLLRHSRVILADLNAAEQSMASLKAGDSRHLRVGVITSGSYFFPHLISGFLQSRTDVEFDLTVRSRDQLVTLLRGGEIDLAVMVHAPDDPAVVTEAFASNPFVLVASPTHPLVHEDNIPYARIVEECLIVRESGTDTRSATNDTFGSYDAMPRFLEIGSAEAIKQSVMAGMGISFLPAHSVQFEVRAGLLKVLDVQGFPLKRHWCVVHRADHHLSPASLDFRQFLLSEGGVRLAQITGMENVQPGMDVPPRDRVARQTPSLQTPTLTALGAGHEVALRTRALLRDERLPEENRIQRQNHAGSDDEALLPVRGKLAHH